MNGLARIAAGLLFTVLAGCGGGGGGGGGGTVASGGSETPLNYVGSTAAAVVTTANASAITAHVMSGGNTSQAISSLTAAPATPGGGMIDIGRQLHRSVRNSVAQLGRANSRTDASSAIAIDETELCDSGSVHFFGTLNDNGTGTVSIRFNACQTGGTTVSGSGTMRIDALAPGFGFTDYTITFTRLTLSGSVAGDLSGSLRTQINPPARTETTTENAVVLFANGIMGKSENLVEVNVYDNLSAPNNYVESVSGRVFHSVHGYVDVSTIVPLVFGTVTQDFPNNGQLLLTGAAGAAIRVTALSLTQLSLGLDLDGNGAFERTVTLAWTDLVGPVGANLADDDGDGMHNSWETANGFNPDDPSDALADADGDGASNRTEYQSSTNPRSAGSTPPGVGLSIQGTSDVPDPAVVGGTLTYTFTVTNSGAAAADNVVVTDTLPAGVNFVSAMSARGSCAGAAPVICTLGTVNAFSGVAVTIVVSPTATGVISNTATVSTSSFDPLASDNSATSVTTVGLPAAGLQGRIDVATPGDTILVGPGLYAGGLDFRGKNVVLRSTGGPTATIIQGGTGTAVRMGPGGSIQGFTITGASFGSGIEVAGSASVISGNIFEGNNQGTSGFGAAIHGNGASPSIERNVFRNNTCDSQFLSGVVAFVNGSSPRVVNNLFVNNDCRGINLTLPQFNTPVVINNTFVGNRVAIRVDCRVSQASQLYRNNIIVQNGIGLELEFCAGDPSFNPVWTNNLVFSNTTDYSGTANLTGTRENISASPLFVNQAAGNYDLQPASLAIDAGSGLGAPTVDFDGALRQRIVDIGAFEGP